MHSARLWFLVMLGVYGVWIAFLFALGTMASRPGDHQGPDATRPVPAQQDKAS